MRLRQYIKLAMLVVPATLAVLGIPSISSRSKAPPPIVAEPTPPLRSQEVAPVETPVAQPGLLVKRFGNDPELRAPQRRRTPPRLELRDPWNGEDLAPSLAMVERTNLEVDRVDPWDPSTQYPYVPGFGDPPADTRDPWVRRNDPRATENASHVVKKPTLDRSSPWESAPAQLVAEATAPPSTAPNDPAQ